MRSCVSANVAHQECVDKICTELLETLCEVVKFDPNMCTYDKTKVAKLREQTGKTTYELFQKKYYETHKTEMDKKIAEKAKKRKAKQVADATRQKNTKETVGLHIS